MKLVLPRPELPWIRYDNIPHFTRERITYNQGIILDIARHDLGTDMQTMSTRLD